MNATTKSIDDWLLTPDDGNCAATACADDQSLRAVARLIMDWNTLREDSALAPDARRQGLLQSLHELQQGLIELSGMPHAALSLGSRQESANAVLAMLAKQVAGDAGATARVTQVGVVSPAFALAAGNAEIELSALDALPDATLDPQSMGALVVPLAMLYSGQIEPGQLEAFRAKGGVVIADGLHQHILPWPGDRDSLPVDIMLLDPSVLFGVSDAPPALLAGERFDALLPVPLISEEKGVYHTQGVQQRPSSIGSLSESFSALPSLIHCFVVLRALGVRGIQERSLKTLVLNRCLLDSMTSSSDDSSGLDVQAIYALEISILQKHLHNDTRLMRWLRQENVPLVTREQTNEWRVSTRQLAALSSEALTQIIAELRVTGVCRLD
jgi:hypothetical protein